MEMVSFFGVKWQKEIIIDNLVKMNQDVKFVMNMKKQT